MEKADEAAGNTTAGGAAAGRLADRATEKL